MQTGVKGVTFNSSSPTIILIAGEKIKLTVLKKISKLKNIQTIKYIVF